MLGKNGGRFFKAFVNVDVCVHGLRSNALLHEQSWEQIGHDDTEDTLADFEQVK